MPLTYDDIDGSWGIYSQNWPSYNFETKEACDVAFRFCVQHETLIPYGCYVRMDNVMRVETEDMLNALLQGIQGKPQPTEETCN